LVVGACGFIDRQTVQVIKSSTTDGIEVLPMGFSAIPDDANEPLALAHFPRQNATRNVLQNRAQREVPEMKTGATSAEAAPIWLLTQVRDKFDLEGRGANHRVSGKEGLIHCAHVDVPALAFRRLDAGQVTHGAKPGLHVSRYRPTTKERLNG
jgi:hypothetical protein